MAGGLTLSSRDRRILMVGVPVAVLLLMLLVGRHLLAQREFAQQRLDTALENASWLQGEMASWRGNRASCVAGGLTEQTVLRTAESSGVSVSAPSGGLRSGWKLEVAGSGNTLLAWLRELSCRGASLQRLEITTLGAGGRVTGQVTLRAL